MTPEDDQSEAGKGGGVQAEEDKKKIHESVFKLTPNRESQGAEIKCMANGEEEGWSGRYLMSGHRPLTSGQSQ